ncbi:hypothetical protein GUJ93_ZPchr0012g21910 [Zizania palustris]|uniref:Uncharacterized protein n=1 Tax=Zizania palustris TaxID=103762 RepID=A0A8J6BS30_ZIZPA|nr:hypothetical protein GUJ93_ZPchr0012g21910 [Zizania palustris]
MTMGRFAKDSTLALCDNENEDDNGGCKDGPGSTDDNGTSPSRGKAKKVKTTATEEDGALIATFNSIGDKLASAIEKASSSNKNDVPTDLFDNLSSLLGFEEAHVSFYYAYLVSNPHIARAFNALPFNHKINWFVMFVSEKFPVP